MSLSLSSMGSVSSQFNFQVDQFMLKEKLKKIDAIIVEAFSVYNKFHTTSVCLPYVINFDFRKLMLSPSVQLNSDGFIQFNVPVTLLYENSDFKALSNMFKINKLPEVSKHYSAYFLEYLKDPILSEKAKKFMLYHEVAHVFNQNILTQPDPRSIKEIEKRADLVAAYMSGAADGAVYLFEIGKRFQLPESPTHPSVDERIAYLKKFDSDPFLLKREVSSFILKTPRNGLDLLLLATADEKEADSNNNQNDAANF